MLEHAWALHFWSFENGTQREVLPRSCIQAGAQCGQLPFPLRIVLEVISGHVWNEPESEGTPKKINVSTWNYTIPVDDHIKEHSTKDTDNQVCN